MADGSLRAMNKRLAAIRDVCVNELPEARRQRLEREEAEAKRMADMSPLERFAYQTTKEINELQQKQLEYNDKISENPEWTRTRDAVACRNEMNRAKMLLKQKADRMPVARTDEEKQQRDALKKVLDRVKKADRPPRSPRASAHEEALLSGGGPGDGVSKWDGEGDLPDSGSYEPIALDQEFQLLMDGFRKQDQEIDRMLEMTLHGVQKISQQTKLISQELKVQSNLLNETEDKMNKVTGDLLTVNKKLKKVIKELDKDKMCLYVICIAILVALVGSVFFLLQGNKSSSDSASASKKS